MSFIRLSKRLFGVHITNVAEGGTSDEDGPETTDEGTSTDEVPNVPVIRNEGTFEHELPHGQDILHFWLFNIEDIEEPKFVKCACNVKTLEFYAEGKTYTMQAVATQAEIMCTPEGSHETFWGTKESVDVALTHLYFESKIYSSKTALFVLYNVCILALVCNVIGFKTCIGTGFIAIAAKIVGRTAPKFTFGLNEVADSLYADPARIQRRMIMWYCYYHLFPFYHGSDISQKDWPYALRVLLSRMDTEKDSLFWGIGKGIFDDDALKEFVSYLEKLGGEKNNILDTFTVDEDGFFSVEKFKKGVWCILPVKNKAKEWSLVIRVHTTVVFVNMSVGSKLHESFMTKYAALKFVSENLGPEELKKANAVRSVVQDLKRLNKKTTNEYVARVLTSNPTIWNYKLPPEEVVKDVVKYRTKPYELQEAGSPFIDDKTDSSAWTLFFIYMFIQAGYENAIRTVEWASHKTLKTEQIKNFLAQCFLDYKIVTDNTEINEFYGFVKSENGINLEGERDIIVLK